MTSQRQASSASQTPHISPAELSYLYTSLSLPNSPIRPDGRSPTQFRPLTAETDVLPGTNGRARIGFADGTQAIVGVKAEVERSASATTAGDVKRLARDEYAAAGAADGGDWGGDGKQETTSEQGSGSWVQMSIEIPGFRDDDALPVFLAEMMREPLVGSVAEEESEKGMVGGLKGRLVINKRWHWRLYIDVCSFVCRLDGGLLTTLVMYRSSSFLSRFLIPFLYSPSRLIWRCYLPSSRNCGPRVRRTRSSTMTGTPPSTCIRDPGPDAARRSVFPLQQGYRSTFGRR